MVLLITIISGAGIDKNSYCESPPYMMVTGLVGMVPNKHWFVLLSPSSYNGVENALRGGTGDLKKRGLGMGEYFMIKSLHTP